MQYVAPSAVGTSLPAARCLPPRELPLLRALLPRLDLVAAAYGTLQLKFEPAIIRVVTLIFGIIYFVHVLSCLHILVYRRLPCNPSIATGAYPATLPSLICRVYASADTMDGWMHACMHSYHGCMASTHLRIHFVAVRAYLLRLLTRRTTRTAPLCLLASQLLTSQLLVNSVSLLTQGGSSGEACGGRLLSSRKQLAAAPPSLCAR